MIGIYAYGPVCFSRMFPSPKRMRIKPAHVVIDTQTIDLFAHWSEPCFFDAQAEADRLEILAKQG